MSTSTNKKDDVLDAVAAAAEKQEDAAIELLSLQHDLSTVASLPSHELAAQKRRRSALPVRAVMTTKR